MIFLAIFTFFIALVSVSVSALVISKPQGLSPFPDSSPLAQLATRTAPAVNDCDAGYIQDHTDDKSPFIADCEALWHNLYYGTVTIILNGETLQAAQYKSCAIGIVSWDCENDKSLECVTNMYSAKIGNEDIGSSLRRAIALAKSHGEPADGRVGAVGMFNCQVVFIDDVTGRVKWSIYWNPYTEHDPWHPWTTAAPEARRNNI